MSHRSARRAIGTGLALGLAACGSGGSTPTPSVSPTPGATSAAATPSSAASLAAGNMPSARHDMALAYDQQHGTLVLFGGTGAAGVLAETWTWDGQRWTKLNPSTSPSSRIRAGMAYDPRSKAILLFGGNPGPGGDLSQQTWSFNGNSWQAVTTAHSPITGPHGVFRGMMTYDAGSGSVVLEGWDGGSSGNTYTWTGSDWSAPNPPACPSATFCRAQGGLAFDPARNQLILAAGGAQSLTDETDAWDGHAWSVVATPTRVSSEVTAAVSDEAHGTLVAATCSGETWLLGATDWSQAHPAHSPTAMAAGCALAYDPTHKVVLLVGVPATNPSTLSMWAWNGQDWSEVPSAA